MTLWTPDGEYSVPPKTPADDQATTQPTGADAPETHASDPAELADEFAGTELSPEDEERARAMAHELAEARAKLLEADVSAVIANHAIGIYELAAIHVTADNPKLDQAKLAIDALDALVMGMEGRLGEAEATLRDALHQIKLGYVQALGQAE